MQDIELITLWKSHDKKLEENLLLNRTNARQITELKIQSLVSSMKPMKLFAVAAGILWIGFVDMLIVNSFFVATPFFLGSAIIQVLLSKLAIGIYLYQLILIHQLDSSKPIVDVQEKLARLKSSTLWVARLLFLQLPVWTTFYLNETMLKNGNTFLLIFQSIVTFAMLAFAIWLFANINYGNRNKRWFQILFGGSEWTPIIKSLEFTQELKAFRNDVG